MDSTAQHPGIILPALGAGVLTGSAGLVTGAVIATLKSRSRVGLFALGMSINWFALGSTYWGYRGALIQLVQSQYPHMPIDSPRDRIALSGAAGALTGATVGLILRGRSNVIPGAIMWGLIGTAGQYAYTVADKRHALNLTRQSSRSGLEEGDFWKRAFRSNWSPIKRLTDKEYKAMLEEKLLVIQADIALVDEEIEKLKQLHENNT
ncbi:hypothetical protein BDZ91DRAFT_82311 [Kalaharituber pfeilii]|nr:hypothetical protein BDZ91DRAFT_82311 [Kalaharituber pfeilii]